MCYLKTFFFNVFIVFFADYILPGIDVTSITKLPHFGWDVIFPILLGLINSLIYPILKLLHQATAFKILGFCLGINFIAYASLKVLPIGIHITSFMGYVIAALVVSIGSFLLNFFEMRHKKNQGHFQHTFKSSNEYQETPQEKDK
ncbi:MAG TPA: phage holin family protein [Chlamydiales bacterium]|nr:phage holin family protein [Chlamydiales bacterium]